jgi:hypothetical protein
MSNTYSIIATRTITTPVSTITFSNIPQDYTDLKIVGLAKLNQGGTNVDGLGMRFNGDSTNNYYQKQGFSTGAFSSTGSNAGVVSFVYGGVTNAGETGADFYSCHTFYIGNYTNSTPVSADPTIYSKVVSVESATVHYDASQDIGMRTTVWVGQNPITSISFFDFGTGSSFLQGSTFTIYGIKSAAKSGAAVKATGGTITFDGDYWTHAFTSGSSSFTPTSNIIGAEVLLVAGGGGGGSRSGGGGGAGGVLYSSGLNLTSSVAYTASVGAGGSGGARNIDSTNGGNSTLSGSGITTLTAIGGGGGTSAVAQTNFGRDGGSGGGGANNFIGGNGTSGQGNMGGYSNANSYDGAGGGGAGTAGAWATEVTSSVGQGAGAGGAGTNAHSEWLLASNTGVNSSGVRFIAGGGGGGSFASSNHGAGGIGGGGAGADTSPSAGTANTGGGGGGCGNSANSNTTPVGANGGSGIILVRYKN